MRRVTGAAQGILLRPSKISGQRFDIAVHGCAGFERERERDEIAMNERGFHQGCKYHEHFMKGPCPYGILLKTSREKKPLKPIRPREDEKHAHAIVGKLKVLGLNRTGLR
jgi:hypothetical protein